MSENLENTNQLRKYLLGQIADEDVLSRIEKRLLTDREFFCELETVEDRLIEDYAGNLLVGKELESFNRLFLNVPERREKIRLTRALCELAREEKLEKKKNGLFYGWIFSPQAAFGMLILCAVAIGLLIWQFGNKQNETDKLLADLRSIQKKQRPVQARVAGFEYAPFVVLRGTSREDKNQIQKRKIELGLTEAVEKNPNAENLNALGSFYLIEKRFDEAAAQFEKALESSPQNVEIRSNLGASFYEKAKTENSDERLNYLDKSLEQLNKAIELNPNLPDAVFNKALVLQELNRREEAASVWKQYLKKDANSKWADEARANLRFLEEN